MNCNYCKNKFKVGVLSEFNEILVCCDNCNIYMYLNTNTLKIVELGFHILPKGKISYHYSIGDIAVKRCIVYNNIKYSEKVLNATSLDILYKNTF